MRIQQVDNRRIKRARYCYYLAGSRLFVSYSNISKRCAKFSWLLDQQSARLARRMGMESLAGVPASFAV